MKTSAVSVVKSSLGSKLLASCCLLAAGCPPPPEDESDVVDETTTGSTAEVYGSTSGGDTGEGSTSMDDLLGPEFVPTCGGTDFVVVAEPGVDCGNWTGAEVVMKGSADLPAMCRVHGGGIEAIEAHLGQIQSWIEDCPIIAPAGVPGACSADVYATLEGELSVAAGVPTDAGDGLASEGPMPIVFVVDAVEDAVPLVIDEPSDVSTRFPTPDPTTWHATQVCRTMSVGLAGTSAELRFIKMLALDEHGQLSGTISDWLEAMQRIIDQLETTDQGRPILVNLAHAWYQNDADGMAMEAMNRVQTASGRSTLFVGAAGNAETCGDKDGPGRPAALASLRDDTVGVSATDSARHPGPSTRPGGMFSTPSPGLAVIALGDVCYASVASSWATGLTTGQSTAMLARNPKLNAATLVDIMYEHGSCVTTPEGEPVIADASQLNQLAPRPARQPDICRSLNAVDGGNRSCDNSPPPCAVVSHPEPRPLTAPGSEVVRGAKDPPHWPGSGVDLPGLDPSVPFFPGTMKDPAEVNHGMTQATPLDEHFAGPAQTDALGRHTSGAVDKYTNALKIQTKLREQKGLLLHNPGMCAQAGGNLSPLDFDGSSGPERPLDCGGIVPTPRSASDCPSCVGQDNGDSVDVHVDVDPPEARSLGAHDPWCVLEVERQDGWFRAELDWDELVGGKWYRLPSAGFRKAFLLCFGDSPWVAPIPIVPATLAAWLAGGAPPEWTEDCEP